MKEFNNYQNENGDENNDNNNNNNTSDNNNNYENNNEDNVESPLTRTEQIFQKMDLDKNGVISEYEFITGCLQDKFLYQMLTADYSDGV